MNTDRIYDNTREQKLIELAKQGKCKSIELFEADFGHWPPNDLTISNPPTGEVAFRPSIVTLLTNPKHWPGLLSPSDIAVMFAITGSLIKAVALSVASKTLGIMGFVDPLKKERAIHINEALGMYGYFNEKSEFLANVISHEHFHVMQRDDQNVSLTCAFEDRTKIADKIKSPGRYVRYLAKEAEMQARIHTILANVYQQHQRLPLTPIELIAALKSHDINVPDEIENLLYLQPKTASEYEMAQRKFPRNYEFVEYNSDERAVEAINKVLGKLKEEHVEEFWLKGLPRLYGDLLEIYGDAYGSERMGLCHNIQLREIFYREIKHLGDSPEEPKKHLGRAYRAVAAMPEMQREELKELVKNDVLYQTPYDTEAILVPREYKPVVLSLFNHHSDIPSGSGIKPYAQKSLWEMLSEDDNQDRMAFEIA